MAEEGYSEVNYKSICCEQIPELFLDKLIAKKHFSKFGKISRFILRPKRLSCTVEYETEAGAERAVEEAGVFNGYEFPVNFAEREVGHVQNTEEWVDADVQSELDAMGGGQNQIRQLNSAIASRMLSVPVKRNSPQRLVPKSLEPTPKIDTSVRSELENLLRQPAYSTEQRYRVLDARDKLIRLTSIKQTDIAKTESRKGICPDMCPEKERLMREFQRQVAIFEINKSSMIGSISHRHAIKEYSRSSADQEVPLSHELRPSNVLKMTMLYLMSRIMDQLDTTQVNISDWFHFVWDRTRSIRKDITQQELCSLDAVELVEQCASFHIHCAARLVAEDPSVFDKKINAENLTKCLQTLKYLYHDLRLKNVLCPREAEFRGYVVLLNLGNSNFLWEVKHLPEHIQHSSEIKRAMAYYNVLQNNNYVRFFNMVREKETSYLSACILLGYFTQLRLRAVEAIVKSHIWRKNAVFLPLDYLTKILGFEDEQAASQFFQFHGLICNERGVLLDKPQPAVDYCMERALKLVESKRTVSVGECICGHPLESAEVFENHQPHNSFDSNGFLRLEAWTAEDQLRGDAALAKAKEKSTQQQSLATPSSELDSVFKVPQTSPLPISKQMQQQTQIQQQQSFKTPTAGFSIFASAAPKETASTSSTSSDSIFNKMVAKSVNSSGSLFGNNTLTNGTTEIKKSIFGSIPKATTTTTTTTTIEIPQLFPKAADSTLLDVPRNDNVFQYFRTAFPDFRGADGGIAERAALLTQEETIKKENLEAELESERLAAAAAAEAQRQLELEQAHKRKQEEIERQRKLAEAAAAERAALERKQKLEILEHCAEKETDALISTTVNAEISKIANSELQLYQSLEALTKMLNEKLLNEFISEEVREIANAEYSLHCHDRMLLERYFNIWLRAARKKIAQRKLLETTPIWVTTKTRAEVAEQLLHPSQMYNMQMIKRYRHGEPCDFRKLLWDEDSELSCRSSVDICEMISKYLALKMPIKHIQQRTYFKLLFTLPAEMDEIPGFGSLCSKWLQQVLRFPRNNNDSSQSYICTLQENVALCVRKVCGTPPINEAGERAQHSECDNVDGIVCFMAYADLASTRRRLHYLLNHSRNFRKLPIAFVVYGNNECDTQELITTLDLHDLRERGISNAFKFYNCRAPKTEYTFKINLEHALQFTIRTSLQKNDEENNWKMEKTQNWLETCLGEEMWLRWQVSEKQNPAFRKVCTILEHVIGLYNAAIKRLCDVLNENLDNAPEFPVELKQFVPALDEAHSLPLGLEHFPVDWKLSKRQQSLLKFMQRIQLPEIQKAPSYVINDLKMWLLDYAGLCIPDDEKSTAAAYYAIKALIEQLTADDLQSLALEDRMNFVSFLPVMKPLIYAHIYEQLQSTSLPAEIVYRSDALQNYLEQPWWLSYGAIQEVTVNYNTQTKHLEQEFIETQDPTKEVLDVLRRAEEVSQQFEQKTKVSKENLQASALDASLLHQLDQSIRNLEAAKFSGDFDVPITVTKRKHSTKQQIKFNQYDDTTEEPSKKRLQESGHTSSEVDEVISRALSLIEKANTMEDATVRLNYTISKLDL